MKFTQNAMSVLNKRYLLRDDRGEVVESPSRLFERVSKAIAEVEIRDRRRWSDKYFEFMINRRFLPNSPTLMNAGKKDGQLSACFVLPIQDSLDSIFDSLKFAAKIHQSGGGTGFSFSNIRAKGSLVRSTHGVASGPVSFMKVFDEATETIKQGGTRRGANMGILRVDHPDIIEFINVKRDHSSVSNFNISVGITNEFMRCVKEGSSFSLRDTGTKKEVKKVSAKEIFDLIAFSAWECGDPGLVFLDRMNLFNPTPQIGPIESTNPCGEQPLLAYESCNLGSLNLGEYWIHDQFDWKLFAQDIHLAVRFLDNVIDSNFYPVAECRSITLRNRKIGLGVMGFADLLLMMGISYRSDQAISIGEKIMSILDREAKKASIQLAQSRGAFPNWKGSFWEKLGYPKLRNATVSTVAPTGTISIIAGASSGIEPLFSAIFTRNVLDGERLVEIHPVIEKLIQQEGLTPEAITEDAIARALGPVWSPSHCVPLEYHIRMQSAFQRHSDSAVSKTINLPENASPDHVREAYLMAFDFGCKGITVYRDQSKQTQVLEHGIDGSHKSNVCVVC